MAVDVEIRKGSYVSDGTLTPRTIGFALDDPADLTVTVDWEPRTLNADYEITGSSPNQQLVPLDGFATNGQAVRFRRVTTPLQDYTIAGPDLKAGTLERVLDRTVMAVQDAVGETADALAQSLKVMDGQSMPAIDKTKFAGKFYYGGPGGNLIPASGTGNDAALRVDLADRSLGGLLVANTSLALRPDDFSAVASPMVDATAELEAMFAEALAHGVQRIDGMGRTFYVSGLVATVKDLIIDNITFKEAYPNSGSPQTVTFNAQTAGEGALVLGRHFRVDRTGDGTVSNLDNSWGACVQEVGRVAAFCEIFGHAKGNGLWVKRARWLYDDSYIHDMFCNHEGAEDDLQHGSWAWLCDYVVTRGLVRHLGSLDRTNAQRDRYSRGRAYSGCTNIDLGGSVGPGIDQAYDVTGDGRNGNSCVRLNGAHADYPFSHGIALKNAVLAVSSGTMTVREPGLCAVMVSGPQDPLVNMTQGIRVSGVTQIGGGANQVFAPEACVVRLNRQGVDLPQRAHPKNVHVTGNLWAGPTGQTTFTVAGTDELAPNLSSPLNVHDCARVRVSNSGGALPSPLIAGTDYWIVLDENGHFHLATSFIRAQDGLFITGLTGGSGTHTVTVQRDCNYGVISEVTDYDKEAPNLVYGNAFGPLVGKHINIKDMEVSFALGVQSLTDSSETFLDASSKTDPYGIAVCGSGYIEITSPYDGRGALYWDGEWASGGSGQVKSAIRMDTGSGLNELAGYTRKSATAAVVIDQSIVWRDSIRRGNKIRFALTSSTGARDYTGRKLVFRIDPES